MWWQRPRKPDQYRLVEANLREALCFFSLGNHGTVEDRNGVRLIYSGTPYAVHNAALFSHPVERDWGEFESRLATASHFFRSFQTRWSLWLCHDLVSDSVRPKIPHFLEKYQARLLSQPPGLIAEALRPARNSPTGLVIQPVNSAATRRDFTSVVLVSFHVPHTVAQSTYEPAHAWEGAYEGWVGYHQGEPVASTAAVVAAGAIGIYSVGTLPRFRQRGYAEAMIRHVAAHLRARHPRLPLILQSTPAGQSIYQRMGFAQVTQFSVYVCS
jgi:ribosomal protein S18 acetylase RimI-like enzyme